MWPVLVRIGSFEIATYGLMVAAAYLLGILWLNFQIKNMGLSEDRFWTLIYSIFIGALVGAKILYVVVDWNGLEVLRRVGSADWPGKLWILVDLLRYGWVFYGGLLGGVVAGIVYVRRHRLPLAKLADYFGVAIALAHWLGRVGCLAAGCCYGRPTEAPWGIRFTDTRSIIAGNAEQLLGVSLHPTQIYEGLGDVLIAIFLYRLLMEVRKRKVREGTVFLGYVLLYAILRFIIEFFRGDDRGGFWLDLSVSQWVASVSFVAAGILLWRNGIWIKKSA